MKIGVATSAEVDQIWPLVSTYLKKATDKTGDDYSTGDLWQMCRSGNAFLVYAHDDGRVFMGSVWQFQSWSRGTVFRCLSLGGISMSQWLQPLNTMIEAMMRDGGAYRFVIDGREGWSRVLQSLSRTPKKLRITFEVEI